MPDSADTPPPATANRAITHFLSAVHQALDLPAPLRRKDQLPYLTLLDQRARLARAGIGRLISNPHADALDYTSEGDHLRHVLADLPPGTYRHDPAEQLLPDGNSVPVSLGMQRLPVGRAIAGPGAPSGVPELAAGAGDSGCQLGGPWTGSVGASVIRAHRHAGGARDTPAVWFRTAGGSDCAIPGPQQDREAFAAGPAGLATKGPAGGRHMKPAGRLVRPRLAAPRFQGGEDLEDEGLARRVPGKGIFAWRQA